MSLPGIARRILLLAPEDAAPEARAVERAVAAWRHTVEGEVDLLRSPPADDGWVDMTIVVLWRTASVPGLDLPTLLTAAGRRGAPILILRSERRADAGQLDDPQAMARIQDLRALLMNLSREGLRPQTVRDEAGAYRATTRALDVQLADRSGGSSWTDDDEAREPTVDAPRGNLEGRALRAADVLPALAPPAPEGQEPEDRGAVAVTVLSAFGALLILSSAWMLIASGGSSAPAPPASEPLRICGSSTIGETAAIPLVQAFVQRDLAWTDVAVEAAPSGQGATVSGRVQGGAPQHVDVTWHGSQRGFSSLQDGGCDVATASSRMPERMREAASPRELLVGRDAIVLLARQLPQKTMSLAAAGDAFATGRLTDGTAVALCVRDGGSGTQAEVQRRLFPGREVAANARRFPTFEQVLDCAAESQGPVLAYAPVHALAHGAVDLGLEVVPLEVGDDLLLPTRGAIKTARWPLSRSLWLYVAASARFDGVASRFGAFVEGDDGQAILADAGFLDTRPELLWEAEDGATIGLSHGWRQVATEIAADPATATLLGPWLEARAPKAVRVVHPEGRADEGRRLAELLQANTSGLDTLEVMPSEHAARLEVWVQVE